MRRGERCRRLLAAVPIGNRELLGNLLRAANDSFRGGTFFLPESWTPAVVCGRGTSWIRRERGPFKGSWTGGIVSGIYLCSSHERCRSMSQCCKKRWALRLGSRGMKGPGLDRYAL